MTKKQKRILKLKNKLLDTLFITTGLVLTLITLVVAVR